MNIKESYKSFRIGLYKLRIKLLVKMSPKIGTNFLYKERFGKKIDFSNPIGFNEKIQWLKLNTFNDLVINCADKFKMREFVKEKECENILPELYGVYNNVNELQFDNLPNKFVLKCTHGCGYNIVCTDKNNLNFEEIKLILDKWMREKYGFFSAEVHYQKMTPRIICEEFIEDNYFSDLADYKIYCFNGEPLYVLVCLSRGKDLNKIFYNLSWEKINLRKDNSDWEIEKPKYFNDMIKYSKKLSNPFPFVRLDFYNSKKGAILGEMTFTPAGGLSLEYTQEGEKILGDLIKLPIQD